MDNSQGRRCSYNDQIGTKEATSGLPLALLHHSFFIAALASHSPVAMPTFLFFATLFNKCFARICGYLCLVSRHQPFALKYRPSEFVVVFVTKCSRAGCPRGGAVERRLTSASGRGAIIGVDEEIIWNEKRVREALKFDLEKLS